MATPEIVKEIETRTDHMADVFSAECKKILDKTTPDVLINVMLNTGIDIVAKAIALLPRGKQGDALEDVLKGIIKGIDSGQALIKTLTVLNKAKEKK